MTTKSASLPYHDGSQPPQIRPWIGPPGPYAGIGSRKTPNDVLALMIARCLGARGFVLRSGGAPGADLAFELGAAGREIYLPWPTYSADVATHTSRSDARLYEPAPEAYTLAAKYHPTWSRLGSNAKDLIARNGHQVLGADLKSPARFILCWTPDGATEKTTGETGGTGQAIRIANDDAYKIPVWNLARGDHRKIWEACT